MARKDVNALRAGTFLGEYRIDSVLGVGAFGITYRAQDTNLDMCVAIKEYFPANAVNRVDGCEVVVSSEKNAKFYRWGLKQFIAEGKVLAQFKHSNIVRISRYFTANNTAYIVMDFEEGESLSNYLKLESPPLSEDRMRQIFVPLLHGLTEVHQKNVLHRDIKSANIYMRSNRSPVLLDFGAARIHFGGASDDSATVLTPGYAPYEQYNNDKPQGPWSDIYAIGATMYRCITGAAPIESRTRQAAVESGQADPVVAATKLRTGRYNADFLRIVDWMLEIEPEDRPQNVQEVLDAIVPDVDPASTTVGSVTVSTTVRRSVVNNKLFITGPPGSGKTTAVSTLSEIDPLLTEANASEDVEVMKPNTTVAMDYGLITLPDQERIHLYGTPGQARFDFMWDVLRKGSIGLILLLDNSSNAPLEDLVFFFEKFKDHIIETRVAIGITKTDLGGKLLREDYCNAIRGIDWFKHSLPPVFSVDARNREDLTILFQALLFSINPGVEDFDI